MGLTIGVDVGGTKVLAGVVDEKGAILATSRRPTPSNSPTETADAIAAAVAEFRQQYNVEAVGIGAAGWIDEARSRVRFAPNLAWRDEPLRDIVEARIGLPVVVENDANAAAWGEYRFGAGRGHSHLILITVGTGIGCGIILDGRLYRGRYGVGGEPGHVRVVPDGRRCGCGNRGCWEQYCSGRALEREAREIVAASPAAGAGLLERVDGDLQAITGPVVTAAALDGDATALECFDVVGAWLGQGVADLAATLDPGCFVIGGGVSAAGELLVGPARKAYEASLTGRGHRPYAELIVAELSEQAGLVGSADLARYRD
ncbi:MAG: glucokinase [Frankiales bacterium]|nr:glucokinase [Frankiales bacterium]